MIQELVRQTTPEEIMQTACVRIAEFLNLSGCVFADVHEAENAATVNYGWTAEGVPSLKQTFKLDEYVTDELRRTARDGEPFVVRDTQTDERTNAKSYAALQVGAVAALHFHWRGRWTNYLAVTDTAPRDWRADEIALLEELSNRIFLRVERTRAEEALRRADERYRTMTDNAPVLIWETDESGLVFSNRHYTDFFGVSFEDVRGMGWAKFLHPDDIEGYTAAYRKAFERRESYSYECRFLRADGEYRWLLNTGHPLGETAFVGFSADITENKRAEEALRESEERLQLIANLVPDLLWDSEPDGSTNWYNRRWLEYTGQSFEEAIGWGWLDAIHPDDREASAQRYREAVENGEMLRQEHRIRRFDGEYRWFVVNAFPLKDERGQVIKMYGAATEIHESRMVHEALRESEEKFRSLFESVDKG